MASSSTVRAAWLPAGAGVLALVCGLVAGGCALTGWPGELVPITEERRALLARASVWSETDVPSMDIGRGPQGPGAFADNATVTCDYSEEDFSGRSPKFECRIGDDEFKVKFGGTNGEVYGEVLASRLLWALGFGADRMYPVTVVCRGCPARFNGTALGPDIYRFAPAVIERSAPGDEWSPEGEEGWDWRELDLVAASPRAHRDAFKLLAALIQHSDSKRENQEIRCLGQESVRPGEACRRPFLVISDLGLTFGRANWTNANDLSGVNLSAWRETPVWKGPAGCVANLARSFSGTLVDPAISEEGRAFLAALLERLTDRQLHGLFDVARVHLRLREPGRVDSGFAMVDEWVEAFKEKRRQIAQRQCPSPAGAEQVVESRR